MSSEKRRLNYFVGVSWFLLSLIVCVGNDSVMKHLGGCYSAAQIVCLRYTFATLSLLILFFKKSRRGALATKSPKLHIFRAIFLFSAILLYCSALQKLPLTTVISLNFVIPLFTLIFARLLLKEKIGVDRLLATIVGFSGVCVVFEPSNEKFCMFAAATLLLSSALFAMLDIINKKFVTEEGVLTMVFYTAAITFLLSLPFAVVGWVPPSLHDISLFAIVGVGANLLLYCILKSFEMIDVSAVAPFRYLELVLSAIVGYFIFHEIPSKSTIIGSLIIIPSVLYIVLAETKSGQKDDI